MSNGLIGEIEYIKFEVYENLVKQLRTIFEDSSSDSSLEINLARTKNSFQNFEISLARAKKQRDYFPIEERRIILEVLESQEYHPAILSGEYLDKLEEIIIATNSILRHISNIQNAKDETGEEEISMWEKVVSICYGGFDSFNDYMDKTYRKNLEKHGGFRIIQDNYLSKESLEENRQEYEGLLNKF